MAPLHVATLTAQREHSLLLPLCSHTVLYSCSVIVLDEIDSLSKDDLYKVFEWPGEKKSKAILIGKWVWQYKEVWVESQCCYIISMGMFTALVGHDY